FQRAHGVRPGEDRGGASDLGAVVGAAQDGAPVLRAARHGARSARADAARLRCHHGGQGPARRVRQDEPRGRALDRRGGGGAVAPDLCDAQGRGREGGARQQGPLIAAPVSSVSLYYSFTQMLTPRAQRSRGHSRKETLTTWLPSRPERSMIL